MHGARYYAIAKIMCTISDWVESMRFSASASSRLSNFKNCHDTVDTIDGEDAFDMASPNFWDDVAPSKVSGCTERSRQKVDLSL
jgi:hypothetical protein